MVNGPAADRRKRGRAERPVVGARATARVALR